MKIKEKIILMVIALIAVIISFLSYKFILLETTNLDTESLNNYNENIDVILSASYLEITKSDLSNERFIQDNISFDNIFGSIEKDVIKSTDNISWYEVIDEFGDVKYFSIVLNVEEYTDFTDLSSEYSVYDIDLKDYYESKGITNNLDLINYFKNYENNTIFTSIYDIKSSYNIRAFYSDFFQNFENLVILTGDLDGYYIDMLPSTTEVHIYEKGEHYSFVFLDNTYFTSDIIQSILNSLEIN